MKVYTVYVSRYNQWADKGYRGTIRTFSVADWTTELIEQIGFEAANERFPPAAKFEVSAYNPEPQQRELADKICDYLNRLEVARSAVKVEL